MKKLFCFLLVFITLFAFCACDMGEGGIDGIYQTAVEWGYTGSSEEFFAVIKGEKGDKGDDGLSAYEIYLKYNSDYAGDERQWIGDLISGRLGERRGVSADEVLEIQYIRNPYASEVDYEIIKGENEFYGYYTQGAEFLQNYNFIVVYITEGSGSIRHEVAEIDTFNSALEITVNKISPMYVTCDMAYWSIVIPIAKSRFDGEIVEIKFNSVDGVFEESA